MAYHIGVPLDRLIALQQERVLGAGGTAFVYKMKVSEEKAQAILGKKELALKPFYARLGNTHTIRQNPHLRSHRLALMLRQEVTPIRAAAQMSPHGVDGVTLLILQYANRWAAPLFQGTLGITEGSVHTHGSYTISHQVLLSEVVLGGAFDLTTSSAPGTPLSFEARELPCHQLVQAVAKLHSANIYHMDVKPQNLLIGEDGAMYLSEFATADGLGETRSCSEQLTPLFMDPAQAACALQHGVAPLDPKYDGWSADISTYNILTGGLFPFATDTASNVEKHLASLDRKNGVHAAEQFGRPKEIPLSLVVSEAMVTIVDKLLEPSRAARPSPCDKWPPDGDE